MPDVFSVPIFLVTFREALETVIIVSVLLAFLKQTLDGDGDGDDSIKASDRRLLHKRLVRQVWLGTLLGLLVCLIIAAALIAVFYTAGANKWDGSELRFEGAFSLVACVIITIVGAALLRIGRVRDKWRVKLAGVMLDHKSPASGSSAAAAAADAAEEKEKKKKPARGCMTAVKEWMEKYAMFALPFVTVLREGIEAVVFIAGVTFSAPASAVPLPVVVGIGAGVLVGYGLYKGGSTAKLQLFLVVSTCLLYLVAAGLFSRAVWAFEQQAWQDVVGGDVAEVGAGPGSYDVDKSVWHVNCCSPTVAGGNGWGFFNAIFGWTNSATYGSVLSYNLYWVFIIVSFIAMRYREIRGHWPLMRPKAAQVSDGYPDSEGPSSGGDGELSEGRKGTARQQDPVEV